MPGMNDHEQANVDLVLEYLDMFGTFEPELYDRYLAEEPTHMAGMKVEDDENLYGLFFEVRDGEIQAQVELLDFRVSTEMFDLSALEQT
jgi:hypothetical protein